MGHPTAMGKFQLLVGCWPDATVLLHMDGPLYGAICNFVSPSASERERQGQRDTEGGREGGGESWNAFRDLIAEVTHHPFCCVWFVAVV